MTDVPATRSTTTARATALVSSILLAVAAVGGCAGASSGAAPPSKSVGDLEAYATDPVARRAALEASLVNPDNGYARLRLAKYTDSAWGALPEWNPPAAPLRLGELGANAPAAATTFGTLDVDAVPWTEVALEELGRRAFFEYPMQLAAYLRGALSDAAAPKTYGVHVDGDRVGHIAWARLPGGGAEVAYTCATCHASVVDGRLVPGRNEPDLAVAAMIRKASGGAGEQPLWGPGRVDVTADDADNPVAITDLRPILFQKNLHHAATLRNGRVALAVRIETLIITGMGEAVRPPRKITAALAVYLRSLAPRAALPSPSTPGAAVFDKVCARCHGGEGLTGEAVDLAVVGTDPAVGLSAERTTGRYRVPSLRGVGDRHRLFASGDVEDVDELLRPGRAAKGHQFGLDLSAADRQALLSYLHAL